MVAISRVQMIHSVVVIIEICYLGFCSRVSFFLIESGGGGLIKSLNLNVTCT